MKAPPKDSLPLNHFPKSANQWFSESLTEECNKSLAKGKFLFAALVWSWSGFGQLDHWAGRGLCF
jgi:hypothetical protein